MEFKKHQPEIVHMGRMKEDLESETHEWLLEDIEMVDKESFDKLQEENATLRKRMDQYLFRGQPIAYWEELEVHAKEMDYVKYIEEILTLKKRVEDAIEYINKLENGAVALNKRAEDAEDDIDRLHKDKMAQWQRAEKAELKAAYWEERWRELREAVARHQAETKFPGELDKWLYKVLEELNSPPAAAPDYAKP